METVSFKPTIHVLMVSFPGQGHINPLLRLAKAIASKGLLVTFSTTQNIGQKMQCSNNAPPVTPIGDGHLRFEFFSDGLDIDDPKRLDLNTWMHQLETAGKESLTQLIKRQAEAGRPVSCLINNSFVPWASDVASDLGIPFAVLWVQSVALYSIYYHYYHNLASFPNIDEPDLTVRIPGLPDLDPEDVPNFLLPSMWSIFRSLRDAILGQFKNLDRAFCVLVDSIEELEREVIDHVSKLSPIKPVGPLYKFSNGSGNIRGDMWKSEENCLQWLDSQDPSSVVYVSFGSIVSLGKKQMEEIASGLLNSGSPFIWVVRPEPNPERAANGSSVLPEGFLEKTAGRGLVVEWCPQDQVLGHPSLACFMTHCGWNSTMESLSSGVPIIGFPQFGDQMTNAKVIVELYGIGVRMQRSKRTEGSDEQEEMVKSEEVEKCIFEVTKGTKAEEMKKNALKWKRAAEEAVAEGGSSYLNIETFVGDLHRLAPTIDS